MFRMFQSAVGVFMQTHTNIYIIGLLETLILTLIFNIYMHIAYKYVELESMFYHLSVLFQ